MTQILWQKAETLWQRPTGGIVSGWSFIVSASPGTGSSCETLKIQVQLVTLL